MRPLPLAALVTSSVLAAAVLATSVLTSAGGADRPATPTRPAAMPLTGPPLGSVAAARAHLAQVPGDWPGWAALGSLELERGRASGDPAGYAAAERAYDTSLRVQPDGNAGALAGLGALAAAKHDFAGAERLARRALAVNSSDPEAYAVLTDALTELGRAPEALQAGQRLDAIRPGLASFSRLSYQAELRGREAEALALMRRAAQEGSSPAQVAFARSHAGTLALEAGDPAGARADWQAGIMVAPDDTALAFLGARLAWADGDRDSALRRFAGVVARRPTVAYAQAQADALVAAGHPAEASAALELARAGRQLAASAGVAAEATDVLFEADHGRPADAVRLGAEVWRRAPSQTSADAYGWALHIADRDAEALPLADRALGPGWRSPAALAHRGAILAALGRRAAAVTDLRAALRPAGALLPRQAAATETLLHRLEATR